MNSAQRILFGLSIGAVMGNVYIATERALTWRSWVFPGVLFVAFAVATVVKLAWKDEEA